MKPETARNEMADRVIDDLPVRGEQLRLEPHERGAALDA
jgi:hypothetical protein